MEADPRLAPGHLLRLPWPCVDQASVWGPTKLAGTHRVGLSPQPQQQGQGGEGAPGGRLPGCLQGEVGDELPPSEVGLVAGGSASRGSPGGGGASI